eukprot:m.135433 g.135433  ORF g.135433 m.135433 type:complete len:90 (-) comp14710_c0_seq11:404-673(-)
MGTLRFVYAFHEPGEPSSILQLISHSSGECMIVSKELNYDENTSYFGSTPLLHWHSSLYIGLVHTRSDQIDSQGIYQWLLYKPIISFDM